MGFFQNTDRRRPTNTQGAWRAAWQLHLARGAYAIQSFVLKALGFVAIVGALYLLSPHR